MNYVANQSILLRFGLNLFPRQFEFSWLCQHGDNDLITILSLADQIA
jgi:hypothetical protein